MEREARGSHRDRDREARGSHRDRDREARGSHRDRDREARASHRDRDREKGYEGERNGKVTGGGIQRARKLKQRADKGDTG